MHSPAKGAVGVTPRLAGSNPAISASCGILNTMENPATWTQTERVIHKALVEAQEAREQRVIGHSTEKRIADALRDAGLITE